MNKTIIHILVVFSTIFPTLNAKELIEVSRVSEEESHDLRQMTYTLGEKEVTLNVSKSSIVVTQDIDFISIAEDPTVLWVELTPEGRKNMEKGTTELLGSQIAIIVNGRVRSAPILAQAPLGGRFQITGFKNAAEAAALLDQFYADTGRAIPESHIPNDIPSEEKDTDEDLRGVVNARDWTMAEFSDFFDEGITVEKVKKAFGPEPLIEKKDNWVILRYEFDSDRLFENGVRMHTMAVFFADDKLFTVETSFTTLSSP